MGIIIVSSVFEELLGMSDEILVLSDGRSIASASSNVFDPQTLTMFAAPRTSSSALRTVVSQLPAQLGCAAYWIDVVAQRVFCFDLAEQDGLSVGILRSSFPLVDETAIPRALTDMRSAEFRTDGPFRSILFELANESGHSFGWLGLTFPVESRHAAESLLRHVATAMLAAGIRHLRLKKGSSNA
jgi:ribose transport system ATP-binding protein/rhamnose transport system ATP-binding protein